MPIFSYLAIPKNGAKTALYAELRATTGCEPISATNQEVIILVTDTPDATAEKLLQERLRNLPSLQALSMTFGHNDEVQPGPERGDHEA